MTDTSFEEEYSEESEEFEDTPRKAAHESGRTSVFVWSVLSIFSLCSLLFVALYCFWPGLGMQQSQKPEPDSVRLMENGYGQGHGFGQILGCYSGDKLKFLNIIGMF